MKKAEIFFATFLLVTALVMFTTSLTYPYKTQFGPGPGFFPLWISGFMILFSLLLIVKVIKMENMGDFFKHRSSLKTLGYFLGALLVSILLIPVIGLILAIGIFCFFSFRAFEKHSWKNSVGVSAGAMVVFYIVFVVWLKVPLPTGIF